MPIVFNRVIGVGAATDTAVRDALARVAFAVQASAATGAPYRTGYLSGSIQAQPNPGGAGMSWLVIAHAHYAAYVELGTYKMAAQPYLVPALRSEWPKFVTWVRSFGGLG